MAYPPVDKTRYSVFKLPNWILIHWVVNPGIAFNELFLGQRMPAVTWIERDETKPLIQRQWAPCPHCGQLSHATIYQKVMLKAWAGLVCARCGGKLPTLKNALTWLVLMITWPIWKPIEHRVGPRMLQRQFEVLQSIDVHEAQNAETPSGLKIGLHYGLWMTAFFFALFWFQTGEPGRAAVMALSAGVVAAVLFGGVMKVLTSRKGRGPKEIG